MQTAHAALECGNHLASIPEQPDNIVLCAIASETDLLTEAARLAAAGIKLRVITEPDLGGQSTAIATEPLIGKQRAPLRQLPLWTPSPSHAPLAHSHVGPPHGPAGGEAPSRCAISAQADQDTTAAWRRCLENAGVTFGTDEDLAGI